MPRTLYGQASLVVLIGVVLAALAFGSRRERLGAGVLAVSAVTGMLAQRLSGQFDPAAPLFMLDAVTMAGFVALTWRSRAAWPFAAAALQGVALAIHLIRLMTRGMSVWTYLTALQATSYGVMAALAVGVWQAARRRGRLRRGFSS